MRHVLIVEDDPPIRNVLATALETGGYVAILSSDLGSAWEKLQSDQPVAVLCDTQVGARELLRRMRAEPALRGVPVFLVSKPFDSVDIVEQLLDRVKSEVPSRAPPRTRADE